MKFRTHRHDAPVPAGPSPVPPADAAASARSWAAAARVGGVLVLAVALAGGVAHGLGGDDTPGSDARTDLPAARDRDLIDGIRRQVQDMCDRGLVAAVHDGNPTVVVVTDKYLTASSGLQDELPLYGGHYVGFADEYAWLVNGTHNVRLVLDDGTELGRRTGPMSDAQVQAIYRENRRRMESATAGLTDPGDE